MILGSISISCSNYVNFMMMLGVSLAWIILNNLDKLFKTSFLLVNIMWLIMVIFFVTNFIWVFYLLFELNIIPMVVILMSWGVNMSRMSASIYMILYTSFFSLPAIFIILINLKLLSFMNFNICNYSLNFFSKFMLMCMFMVKIPIFGLHFWLPKAHVEASTIGSMILASGLLKMGGTGFIKIMLWARLVINNSWLVLGAAMSSLLCCFQSDQKKLIAMSSVAHMSFSTASMMSLMYLGCESMILYGFTHSVSSSLMFYNGGVISSFSKTRLFYYIPKFLNSAMILIIVSIFINLGLPPSISFLAELFSITSVFNSSHMTMLTVFMMLITSLMFSFIYTMMCYQSTKQYQQSLTNMFFTVFSFHMLFMFAWLMF